MRFVRYIFLNEDGSESVRDVDLELLAAFEDSDYAWRGIIPQNTLPADLRDNAT